LDLVDRFRFAERFFDAFKHKAQEALQPPNAARQLNGDHRRRTRGGWDRDVRGIALRIAQRGKDAIGM
jgi:hypothetical protein